MTKPLFLQGMGDFIAVRVKGFAPRWVAKNVFEADSAQREKRRREVFEESTAAAKEKCSVRDDPHTLVYTQSLDHPRLLWATRRLEVWKGEPRARFTLRLNRTASEAPEVFYIGFPLPCESTMPQTSCGGISFIPFRDQLPAHAAIILRSMAGSTMPRRGGPLAVGEPRCAAGDLRLPAGQGGTERSASRNASSLSHDFRQSMACQFRRR